MYWKVEGSWYSVSVGWTGFQSCFWVHQNVCDENSVFVGKGLMVCHQFHDDSSINKVNIVDQVCESLCLWHTTLEEWNIHTKLRGGEFWFRVGSGSDKWLGWHLSA